MAIAYTSCYHFGFLKSQNMKDKHKRMALLMAIMANHQIQTNYERKTIEAKQNIKKSIETKPKKGQYYYWFTRNGDFLNKKQDSRFETEAVYFTCWAINDHNAKKKFYSFMRSNQAE